MFDWNKDGLTWSEIAEYIAQRVALRYYEYKKYARRDEDKQFSWAVDAVKKEQLYSEKSQFEAVKAIRCTDWNKKRFGSIKSLAEYSFDWFVNNHREKIVEQANKILSAVGYSIN